MPRQARRHDYRRGGGRRIAKAKGKMMSYVEG